LAVGFTVNEVGNLLVAHGLRSVGSVERLAEKKAKINRQLMNSFAIRPQCSASFSAHPCLFHSVCSFF